MSVSCRVVCLGWLVLSASQCAAQTDAPRQLPAADVQLLEAGPPTVYLLDEEGRPFPVVGLSLSALQQAYRIQAGLDAPHRPPRYSVRRVEFDGVVEQDRARLDAEIDVQTHIDGWVHVPLRLGEAHLQSLESDPAQSAAQEPVTDRAEAIRLSRQEDGYHLWIQGRATEQRTIRLRLLVALEKTGRDQGLSLSVPSAVDSRLTLRVPPGDWIATVNEGALLENPATSGSAAQFVVRGLAPVFRVSWQPKGSGPAPVLRRLEVVSRIQVRVDALGNVTSDVELNVDGHGQTVRELRLTLPPGTRPIDVVQQGYSLTAAGGSQNGQVEWDVVFDRPGPTATVRLRTQSDPLPTGDFAVASYEVAQAARHTGTLTLSSEGNWRTQWIADDGLRRLPDAPPRPEVLARFEYFRQPCSLQLNVRPLTTRLVVEPIYRVDVLEDRVELLAVLRCRVRGGRQPVLDIRCPGWTVDDVGPENLVRTDELVTSDVDPLRIPLQTAATGDFELRVTASRPVLPGGILPTGTPLDLNVPQPVADTVTPALVVVNSSSNVALEAQDGEAGDFALSTVPPELAERLGPWSGPPQCFRLRVGASEPSLQLNGVRLARSVSVRTKIELLELTGQWARVRQQFLYRIENAALPVARLLVPPAVDQLGDVEVLVNGEEVATSRVQMALPPFGGELILQRVNLPHPALGRYDVTATYTVPGPGQREDQVTWNLPLLRPQDGQLLQQSFHARPLPGWQVALSPAQPPAAGPWTLETNNDSQVPGEWLASAVKPEKQISLRLRPSPFSDRQEGTVVIERAWLQSWLTSEARQDRAVYQLAGARRQVQLLLPGNIDPARMHVIVDRRMATDWRFESGVLVVSLAASEKQRRCLEVIYQMDERPPPGLVRVALPEIKDAAVVRQWFWHLVLPGNESLLTASPQLTAANRWAWTGWGWWRQPQFTQGELEQWTDATHQQPVLGGSNQYLFGAFQELPVVTVRTATLASCLLMASGGVLVLGLLLISVPRLRSPYLLLPLALGLLAVATIDLSAAAVLGQASVLGLLLILLARLLGWLAGRATGRPAGSAWTASIPPGPDRSVGSGSSRVSAITTTIHSPTAHPSSVAPR